MRPKKTQYSGTDDLFRSRLDQTINMRHELVRPACDRDPVHDRSPSPEAHLRAIR